MADGAAGGKEEADLEEKVGAGSGAGDAGDSELLVWADLDDAATGALLSDEARADVDAQYRQLAGVMGLEDYETNPRRHILLDFHFYNLQFAQEVGFSDAQTSAFFSIMKATIDHASAKSSSQQGGGGGAAPRRPSWEAMEANFEHFRKLILAHSTGTGDEEPLFTLQDVKAVTSFVTKSFYRHYAAYAAVFCSKQPTAVWARSAVVETPLRPPPLSQATPA